MLSVHQISNLTERKVPGTDDSFKFDYVQLADGSYQFSDVKATVLAIVSAADLVETVGASDTNMVPTYSTFLFLFSLSYFFLLIVLLTSRLVSCLTRPISTPKWVVRLLTPG